jgi:hypothetical protein
LGLGNDLVGSMTQGSVRRGGGLRPGLSSHEPSARHQHSTAAIAGRRLRVETFGRKPPDARMATRAEEFCFIVPTFCTRGTKTPSARKSADSAKGQNVQDTTGKAVAKTAPAKNGPTFCAFTPLPNLFCARQRGAQKVAAGQSASWHAAFRPGWAGIRLAVGASPRATVEPTKHEPREGRHCGSGKQCRPSRARIRNSESLRGLAATAREWRRSAARSFALVRFHLYLSMGGSGYRGSAPTAAALREPANGIC